MKVLLEDPNTPKLAEKLEMSLEDYVSLVVHYVMNPSEQPMLNLVKDEDLAKAGLPPVSNEAMNDYLEQAVALAEATETTGFAEAKKEKVSMSGGAQQAVDPAMTDPKLKADLEKALRKNRKG